MRSPTVLHLDPDPAVARAVRSYCETEEPAIRLTQTDSPTAAQSLLETESIDCLLMEWHLPETDTQAFLQAVRETHPTLPVCCFTSASAEIVAAAFACGVTEYIQKQQTNAQYLAVFHRIHAIVESDTSAGVISAHSSTSSALPESVATEDGHRVKNGHGCGATQAATTAEESSDPSTPQSPDADTQSPNPSAQPPDADTQSPDTQQIADNVVEKGKIGIIVFDTDGLITRVNPSAEAMLQLPAAEAIGNDCRNIRMQTLEGTPLPIEDRPVGRVLKTGESVTDQVVGVTIASGDQRWFSITAIPLTDGSPSDGIVVTLVDISAEIELETTLNTVLDRMTDGFVAFNRELELTYFSDQAINTDRYPDKDYVGKPLSAISPTLAQYEPIVAEVLETQTPKTIETFVPEPTGEWVRARLYPSETGVSVFFQDITDQKRSQRALEQFQTIVESVKDGVCILDDSLEFVYVNEALASLVGYDRDALCGQSAAVISDASDMETVRRRRSELIAGDLSVAVLSGEITAKSGERVPVETWITPIELLNGEIGTVGVVRDRTFRRRTEASYTTLYEAAHRLLSVHTDDEIAEIGVETALEVLPEFSDAVVFRYEKATNSFQPRAHSPAVETHFPGVPAIKASETSLAGQAFFEGRVIETEDMSQLSGLYDPETPYRQAMFTPIGTYGVLFVGETDETNADGVNGQTRALAELVATTLEAAFSRLASEQQSQTHQQQLAEQAAELQQLSHFNSLVRDLGTELFQARTRDAVESTVCSLLTDTDRYQFAWIGEIESRSDELTVRAWQGDGCGYLDWLREDTAGADGNSAVSSEPTYRAARESRVISVDHVADGWDVEPWRKMALARGYQSVLSVPLRYNQISYGVLSLYDTEPDAFDDYAQTVLAEFGEIIGYVIANVETRHGLLTDNVTEVELDVPASDDSLSRLAATADCRLTFEGFVPQPSGQSLVYVSADDVDSATLEAVAEGIAALSQLRVVSSQHGHTLLAVRIAGPLLAATLLDCGALPETIEIDGTIQQAVVSIPQTTSVRVVIDRVRREYPMVELVARRARNRGIQTRETFHTTLQQQLTSRQRDVLWAAFLGQYFESPRGSTGTQIAESLGITQPTFTYHLRGALRTLLTMLFSETAGHTLED